MARTVKSAEDRQDQILEVAARLFAEHGYDNTTIKAILDEVGIAKGTFYHHFRSKEALLDGLLASLTAFSVDLVQPVFDDPDLGAIDKFVAFFGRVGAWKVSQRALFLNLGRAIDLDANALMQKRAVRSTQSIFVPMLARIIEQGVDEGVFDTAYAGPAAAAVMQITTLLSMSIQDALRGRHLDVAGLQTISDAMQDAIERVLGAPSGSIVLVDPDSLGLWVQAANAAGADP